MVTANWCGCGCPNRTPAIGTAMGSVSKVAAPRPHSTLRAAWLRPKQTDLVPGKGQSRYCRFLRPEHGCRSASVIGRLLKNQNLLEMVIIFDHLGAPWSWADVRGTAPQFCGPKLIDTGHGCSDRRRPVRAFDDSTTRRSAAAASRGPRPEASRAGGRLRRDTGSSALFSRR